MTLDKKKNLTTASIVGTLLALIFLPSQIPIDSVKIAAIAIFGGTSLVLQLIVMRRTAEKTQKIQSIILLALTVTITTILLLI